MLSALLAQSSRQAAEGATASEMASRRLEQTNPKACLSVRAASMRGVTGMGRDLIAPGRGKDDTAGPFPP